MYRGFIKLWRKLLQSQMYKNLNSKQRDVLITCLLLANHQENEWEWGTKMYKCEKGQFITSLEHLKQNCANDIKVQSVRTSLLKLEKWGFLTNKSTKTGRLINVLNWHKYQDDNKNTNKDINKEPTKSQQRANKELTTNKNDKNDKNILQSNDCDFSFKNYLEKIKTDKKKHIRIIGKYIELKGYSYRDKKQFQAVIKRHLREATSLAIYDEKDVLACMAWQERQNEDFDWRLSTIVKRIDDYIKANK